MCVCVCVYMYIRSPPLPEPTFSMIFSHTHIYIDTSICIYIHIYIHIYIYVIITFTTLAAFDAFKPRFFIIFVVSIPFRSATCDICAEQRQAQVEMHPVVVLQLSRGLWSHAVNCLGWATWPSQVCFTYMFETTGGSWFLLVQSWKIHQRFKRQWHQPYINHDLALKISRSQVPVNIPWSQVSASKHISLVGIITWPMPFREATAIDHLGVAAFVGTRILGWWLHDYPIKNKHIWRRLEATHN